MNRPSGKALFLRIASRVPKKSDGPSEIVTNRPAPQSMVGSWATIGRFVHSFSAAKQLLCSLRECGAAEVLVDDTWWIHIHCFLVQPASCFRSTRSDFRPKVRANGNGDSSPIFSSLARPINEWSARPHPTMVMAANVRFRGGSYLTSVR